MFLFNRKQKVKRWLVDRNFIEAKMTEQINAASKLVFSVPLKQRLPSSYFFAAIPQPRGSDYLLFKIINEQVQSDRVQYTCIEAAYDELKSYHYIKDDRPQNRSAADMLKMALDGTRWEIGTTYDAGTASTNFYYISSLEAIQKIANIFQLEVVFSIVLDPRSHQITRRLVNLLSQQGQRTGKRFEYGSNLLSVEREESSENLITALIGRGKGEEIYHNESGQATQDDQTPDGYGRRINFADVVWSKKNGNPVDKPAGQEYVEDPDATAAYGFDDGMPRIGIEIFEDITDPTELLQATWSALQTLKRPRVSFKANVMDVGDLGLGDTVAIIRHDIKIEYFTRVYKVEHNLLNERLNTIELGDDLNSQSITSTVNSIASAVNRAGSTANYAAISANGKNANYYGQGKPLNPVEGDLWYKDLGNGGVDLYQFHDGNWILITSTRDLHNVEKQVNQKIDDLKEETEANTKKRDAEINKAISDTQTDIINARNEAADRSKKLADDATALQKQVSQNVIDITKLNGQLDQSQTDLNNISQRLAGVADDAKKNTDGITSLNKTIGQIQITVADTEGNVDQLTKRADKSEEALRSQDGRLNVVEKTSSETKESLTDANDNISQLIKRADGFDQSIRDNAKNINNVQTTAKFTQQTLANAQGDINKLVDRANKSEKTIQDQDGRIYKLETSATENKQTLADQQGNINQLTDRVDGTEQSIKNNADALNQIKINVSSLTETVTNNQGDINQFKIDLKGLKETVSDNSGKFTNIQADINGIRNIVKSKADLTYVDQKSNEWSVNLKKVSDQTTDLRNEVAWQTINHAVDANSMTTTGNYWIQGAPNKNTPDDSAWTFLQVVKEYNGGRIVQTWQRDNNADEQFTRLYTDNKWSDWKRTITNSTLIAQINVAAGTTLIQNDRIYMDASSTVFSGSAFIPSAAITDLSADKITTGTLNAGNVNIINMNADNITAGTIKGMNLSINLNSGEVEFQSGRIHDFNNFIDINVDEHYISTADLGTRALLKNGELQLTQYNMFDTNGDKWYFRLYNDSGGAAFASACLVGRNSVTIANKANVSGGVGLTASPMGVATFSGLFTGQGAGEWEPTILEGAERGVFIKGGASIKSDFMNGGQLVPGSPFIAVGSNSSASKFWDNRIVIDGEYVHIPSAQRQTTGNSPNLFVAADGALVRSTSASKYKTMIERSHSLDYGERLLSLPTATWLDKAEKRRYVNGESKDKPVMHFGMIAEDLANAGLDMLVSRGQDGELEGIQYDRIAPALLPVIKNLKDRIEKLEEQINGKESTISSINQ